MCLRYCKECTKSKRRSFFRIRKDPEMARLWLIACCRKDLLGKSPTDLYNNYKICENHFEERMFSSPEKKRLLRQATPTIFPHLEGCSSLSQQENLDSGIKILEETPSTSAGAIAEMAIAQPLQIDAETSTLVRTPPTASASSQTPLSFSSRSPRKLKLRAKLKDANRRLALLKKKLPVEKRVELLTLFDKLCDVFLPGTLANFVKMKSRLSSTRSKEQRHSIQ